MDHNELVEYSLLRMPDDVWEEYYYGRSAAIGRMERALKYGSRKLRELDRRLFGANK